jgi:pimeloyl-ACP methyl ester carboxylesterase
MTFVLVHGGGHGAWCWDPMLPYLDGSSLAVDLPGRGKKPGDLEKLTLDDFAASVVADIEATRSQRIVLVGHSMAGLTIPRVLERMPERIASVVFVSCLVPREGQTLWDAMGTLPQTRPSEAGGNVVDDATARYMFCNDMDEAQARFVLSNLCGEAARPMTEPVSLAGLRRPVARSYVKLLRDQALTPEMQDGFIRNAGPDTAVHELDAGHNAMISRPRELAAILNRISRGTR